MNSPWECARPRAQRLRKNNRAATLKEPSLARDAAFIINTQLQLGVRNDHAFRPV